MKPENFKLIVLDDFSNNTETNFHFISLFNKLIPLEIILLHIVDKENIAKMQKLSVSMDMLLNNLQQRVDKFAQQFNLSITSKIEKGTIFDSVPKIALHEKADLILFSTLGITTFQKLVGSNAFRLLEKSSVPIAIVHSNEITPFKKIITNTNTDIQKYLHLFDFSLQQIEKYDANHSFDDALILFEISPSAFIVKEEQKSIEQIIFNPQNMPIICWKSNS